MGMNLRKFLEIVKDREAWWLPSMGLQRVRHDWATSLSSSIPFSWVFMYVWSKEFVLDNLKLKGNILRIKCDCMQTLGCTGGESGETEGCIWDIWRDRLARLHLICLSIGPITCQRKNYVFQTKNTIVWSCSITDLCSALCDSRDFSTPGFPVLHCLCEFALTHVHSVSDAV